jgi:hypothetical protein
MKFYSEVLNKLFDNAKDLKDAEHEYAMKHSATNALKEEAQKHIDNIIAELAEFGKTLTKLEEAVDNIDEAESVAIELISKLMAAVSKL